MIGSLKGKITLKKDKFVIVEVCGVGYKVNVSPDTLLRFPAEGNPPPDVFLFTHLHVREDAQDLYGFLDYADLEFFEMLIGISGIGPRGALAILGIAPINTLKKAISSGDISYLTKISGIGKKTAEKIVLELRDKVGKELAGDSLQEELDSLEALKSLGYSQHEAREALRDVPAGTSVNAKVKEALRILSGK